jgi:hypothetical protein
MKNLDFGENDSDSDKYDNEHEENKTVTKGAKFVKQKFKRTADHETFQATPLDADLLPLPDEQPEDEQPTEAEPPRADDAIVRQRNKEKLAAALAAFKLPELPKEPANDNYRPVVSWPLTDQLTRTFEPDRELRNKLIATARYVRDLIDTARADPLGDERDCGIQRTESGKAHFEHGQTLDRKKRIYNKGKNGKYSHGKNGEADAERFDGAVRTARKISAGRQRHQQRRLVFGAPNYCPERASRDYSGRWPAVAVAGIRHKRQRDNDRCRQIAWREGRSSTRRRHGPHPARYDGCDGSP